MPDLPTAPKNVYPVETNYNWDFPLEDRHGLASFACIFEKPFWADFSVDKDTRTIHLPDGVTITETRLMQMEEFYIYESRGVPGISDYQGLIGIAEIGDEGLIRLTWATSFQADSEEHMKYMLEVNAGAVPEMTRQLKEHFAIVPTRIVLFEPEEEE